MDKDRWQRLRRLFTQSGRLPPAERRAWLDAECADEPELVDEVLELLGSSAVAGSGIDEIVDAAAADYAGALPEGERIGPYRVLDTLGRGGMGQVYLAERADDEFRQRVAIKTVGWLGAAPEIVARFRAERQILADLQHPHIARLLDGGHSDAGTPYLVMEFVDGEAITDWCDARSLALADRLDLFLKVCDAVRYAHRKLIVHRDIKPTNILVDADGNPKLLDFGIAKLLEPGSDAEPFVTRADMRVLTPEYASPEQVRGEAATTATDVYGLGMLLYQLLTGRFPYEVAGATSPEIADMICNTEPTAPSTAVVRGGDALPMPLSRTQLAKTLSGDLDNIVMMALRKEPERRYESVRDLARDVEHYLALRPVSARTPSLGYRAARFMSRNRTAVAAGTAAVLAIVAMTAWYTHRLAIERDIAMQERRTAEAATDFMIDLFEVSDPGQSLGETLTAREVLDSGAEKLRGGLADTPVVRARLLQTLGMVYERLGLYDEAEGFLEESAELSRRVLPRTNETQIRGLEQLAWIAYRREDWARSSEFAREALELRESLVGPDDPSLAEPLNHLGTAAYWMDDMDASLRYYHRALALLNAASDEEQLIEKARTLNHLGIVYAYIGRSDDAEEAYLASLDLRLSLFDARHPLIGAAKANLAAFYHGRADFETARTFATEALEIDRAVLGDEHVDVAHDLGLLAGISSGLGDYNAAERYARESADTWGAALGRQHSRYGSALDTLANAQMELGRLDEALATAEASYIVLAGANGPEHTFTADALYTRGRIRYRRGEYAAAKPDIEKAYEIRSGQLGEANASTRNALTLMSRIELGLGNTQTAESHAERLLALVEANEPDNRVYLRRALTTLREAVAAAGDADRLQVLDARLAALAE